MMKVLSTIIIMKITTGVLHKSKVLLIESFNVKALVNASNISTSINS